MKVKPNKAIKKAFKINPVLSFFNLKSIAASKTINITPEPPKIPTAFWITSAEGFGNKKNENDWLTSIPRVMSIRTDGIPVLLLIKSKK